jgi:hypothetical protein
VILLGLLGKFLAKKMFPKLPELRRLNPLQASKGKRVEGNKRVEPSHLPAPPSPRLLSELLSICV